MERRLSGVLGALLLGFLVCPTDARAHCHDARAIAEIEAKTLARAECRSFVLVDYTEAWGNEQRAADDLLTADAELTIEESPTNRYRGAEARRKFQADQSRFKGTYYTAVITGASHVAFEAGEEHGDYAQNLARVSWTGVVRCRERGCKLDISEKVVAILALNVRDKERPRWRIVSASIVRREIKPPPTPSPKT